MTHAADAAPCRIILIVLTLAAFVPVFRSDFVHWDDYETIAKNPALNPPTARSLLQFWSVKNPQMDLYVPVTYTWWSLLAKISPTHAADENGITLSPLLFHATNLLLHVCSALIVFQILGYVSSNSWMRLIGALVFAVHPVQAETISWASGGKDVLCGFFMLAAVWQYVRFVQTKKLPSYFIALAAYILAMLSKPTAVTTPLIVMGIDFLLLRNSFRRVMLRTLPWLAAAIPIVIIGKFSQPAPTIVSPIWFRPIVALDAIAFYIGKIVWPFPLTLDYGRSPRWLLESSQRFWTWIAPVFVLIICSKRKFLAGVVIFIAAILPVLGWVSFDFQAHSTVADHYLYAAMLGVAIVIVLILEKFRVPMIAMGVIVLMWAGLTFRQCNFWHDTRRLFEHDLAVNPTSLAANSGLGLYWTQHGDDELAAKFYQSAIDLYPDFGMDHFNYANLLRKHAMYDAAIEQYTQAIALQPEHSPYYVNFGVALAMAQKRQQAMQMFQQAIHLDPNNADAHQNYGLLLESAGQWAEAREQFEITLRLDPMRVVAAKHLEKLSTTRQ